MRRFIGWDIETHDSATDDKQRFNPHHGNMKVLTVAWHDGEHAYGGFVDFPGRPRDEWAVGEVRKLLLDPFVTLVGHNVASFDLYVWRALFDVEPKCQFFDTRVAGGLLDPEGDDNSLDAWVQKFLPGEKKSDMQHNRAKLIEEDPDEVLDYNKDDARLSLALAAPFNRALAEKGLSELSDMCMGSLPAMVDMMHKGTYVDEAWAKKVTPELKKQRREAKEELDAALQHMLPQFHKLNETKVNGILLVERMRRHELNPGCRGSSPEWLPINYASSKQMVTLLQDWGGCKLPVHWRTRKPKTDEESLVELRSQYKKTDAMHEFLTKILEFREAKKLLNTYLEPLVTTHLCPDGRVHTRYFMGKAYDEKKKGTQGSVSRLSSSSPNLQNQPRDGRVRGVLAASPGMRIAKSDYSQIELRIGAWEAQEEVMLDAIRLERDIHTATLADLEQEDYDEVVEWIANGKQGWKEKRAVIKTVNFGVFYGATAWRLQKILRDLGIEMSIDDCQRYIDRWFHKHSSIKNWMKEERKIMVETGKVVTKTGRFRDLPGARRPGKVRDAALRQGINFRIQGLAFDAMVSALRHTHDTMKEVPSASLIMTVHDELLMEYDPKQASKKMIESAFREGMLTRPLAELETRFGITGLMLATETKTGIRRWGE